MSVLRDQVSEASLPSDSMRDLFAFWQAARGDQDLAPDSAIDPLELPKRCLPYLTVLEVERPLRFRVRLVGTKVVEATGRDYTGRYLDSLAMIRAPKARLAWCVEQGRPYLASDRVPASPLAPLRYDALTLPFADGAGEISRLVIQFLFYRGGATRD